VICGEAHWPNGLRFKVPASAKAWAKLLEKYATGLIKEGA
jgi:hypothetical protein